jgi:DNA-binding LytR/AlgR family response regulator
LMSMSGIAMRMEMEEPAAPRLSGTALIVEDNLIIAMSAEVILLELGARHVDTAASVKQALGVIGQSAPSFALLDLNLGSESSIPVGEKLMEMNIPFIFATGYGERAPIPQNLSSVPVIQKPYTREVVEGALTKLRENSR